VLFEPYLSPDNTLLGRNVFSSTYFWTRVFVKELLTVAFLLDFLGRRVERCGWRSFFYQVSLELHSFTTQFLTLMHAM